MNNNVYPKPNWCACCFCNPISTRELRPTPLLSGIATSYALPILPGLRQHIPHKLHAGSAQIWFRFNSFIALALADRLGGAPALLMIAVLIGVCVPLFNVAAV